MIESTRDPADVAAWLRLTAMPGVSALSGRRLLAAFGLPQTVLAQDAAMSALIAPNVANEALAELELGGVVERMPGNRYRRLA